MINFLPTNIPELRDLSEAKKAKLLQRHGKRIWWRFALVFLFVFVVIHLLVGAVFEAYLSTMTPWLRPILLWLVELTGLLLIMMPMYCILLRRDINRTRR